MAEDVTDKKVQPRLDALSSLLQEGEGISRAHTLLYRSATDRR